jgi:hypothetical protein
MTAEELELHDHCHRLAAWSRQYHPGPVTPLRAIYACLEVGLTASSDPEKSAESRMMELAANPGLNIEAVDLYSLAVHFSKLASILVAYLRGNDEPWVKAKAAGDWEPNCYEVGDTLRRVVLIDHWSDQRKMAEVRSWRTVAETSMLNKPMLLNFISIGSTNEGRRVSPWTRTLKHPRNGGMRFAKRGSNADGFTESWIPVWRENSEVTTLDWLGFMQKDGVFDTLVHSIRVPASPRRAEFVADVERIGNAIELLPANPPMTRSACYGISPCKFCDVCHSQKVSTPADFGWIPVGEVTVSR